MTNSAPSKAKSNTGTEVRISQDAAKFSSQRGAEFEIVTLYNGLFQIKMKRGGKTPPMCDELFTSRMLAEKELVKYLKAGDKLGYANYPDKEK